MKAPEPKFAVIVHKEYSTFEMVCCDVWALLIMKYACSLFGNIQKARAYAEFPFSFRVSVNPLYNFNEVVAFIQDGLNQIQEAMDED